MLERLKQWLRQLRGEDDDAIAPAPPRAPVPRAAPPKKVPRPNPEYVEADEEITTQIDSNGPGKNVLIRNKYLREDTGTHETLKILDDSMVDSGEESGIDPYNTGGFDRSKNWDKRFGK